MVMVTCVCDGCCGCCDVTDCMVDMFDDKHVCLDVVGRDFDIVYDYWFDGDVTSDDEYSDNVCVCVHTQMMIWWWFWWGDCVCLCGGDCL